MLKDLITPQVYFVLKLLAVLGCGLIAGVFFAFSSFIMGALGRLSPPTGIVAMQSINITVINPSFMVAFMGTACLCIFLAIAAGFNWHQPGAPYLLLGSLLYLIGTVGVTMAGNVPLNNALAMVKPDSPASDSVWARYLTSWTFWNHLRTAAALAAAALFSLALR
ncbi:MAG: DUF1772 domain-containing protein [Nodosilinea sp.]